MSSFFKKHSSTNKKMHSCQISKFKSLFSKESFFNFTIILENAKVRLRPLDITDQEHLTTLALNQDIWAYFALRMSDSTSITNYIKGALQQRMSRSRYTFIIEDPVTKTIMGSIAFGNFSKNDKRIELGWS
ncbi:GNAT family N-acetyltransferase [Candidatus Rhabdochlamydia sp. T3358]|uniref:GNAT family N-acetyltransferase n=1 Tax=Candidatus Rhabdochlamydia sp. T3358 TaxID=2099795 RepID=UPI0010B7D43B|nr:GNAT family N-acetyltransferase [Candidatus Rhabdochlamydia sp. T3358]VHO03493.1 hypothetical protein RHT_00944 [Candidatus Rhabdochlamydia sp. T3358]